jgi:Flp pilus assembly protein TadD
VKNVVNCVKEKKSLQIRQNVVERCGQGKCAFLSGDTIVDDELRRASPPDMARRQLEQLPMRSQLGLPAACQRVYPTVINSYAPGETILPAQARAECLGLVVRGRVAVHPRSRWDSWPSVVLRPGQTFGQSMLAQGRPCGATLRALTSSEVWFLRGPKPGALAAEHPVRSPATPVWQQLLGVLLLVAGLVAVLALGWSPIRRASSLGFMGLGQWCSQLGHDPCAERAWTVAAALVPQDAHPHLALGTLYSMRGELAAAEASFEQAQELDPGSPEVLNNLGYLYAARGEHERALSVLHLAQELEPGNAVIEHNLGRSLQALGARDEALLHYASSLALGGSRAVTLANMAIAYYETGQLGKAREVASEALRYDDGLAPAHAVLAAAALESGQPEEAVLYLHRALSLDSGFAPAHLFLGLTYRALGQDDRASAAFHRALRFAEDEGMRLRLRQLLEELHDQQRAGRSP